MSARKKGGPAIDIHTLSINPTSQPPPRITTQIQFENFISQIRERARYTDQHYPDGEYLDFESVKKVVFAMIHNTRWHLRDLNPTSKTSKIKMSKYMREVIRPAFK